jgi:hypothetical protein
MEILNVLVGVSVASASVGALMFGIDVYRNHTINKKFCQVPSFNENLPKESEVTENADMAEFEPDSTAYRPEQPDVSAFKGFGM